MITNQNTKLKHNHRVTKNVTISYSTKIQKNEMQKTDTCNFGGASTTQTKEN